jgi:histidine triad (HIT) family protein
LQVDECPFCAIAQGRDTEVETVAEAAEWVAFFPLDPATPGHTLVIPRAHFPDLWSVPTMLGQSLMRAVIAVGRAIGTAMEPEGMNLISSSGAPAEQTVFHLHLHLVPRWADDGFGRIWPADSRLAVRSMEGLVDSIREAYQADP